MNTSADRVYLDHAATSPTRPEAIEAFVDQSQRIGNASSLHTAGRGTKLRVEDARDRLAAVLGAHPTEVIYTSGGTESDNLGLQGLYHARHRRDPRRHQILFTGIEHAAVIDTLEALEAHHGAELIQVPVDATGRVEVEAWKDAIDQHADQLALATMMYANNEIGTVQPIAELAEATAAAELPFHVDAVQAFGALELHFDHPGVTTMAISGHKIGAPIGIGALLVRRDAQVAPVLFGGGQERDIRSGTMASALIVSFTAAAEVATANQQVERERLSGLRDRLIAGIQQAIPEAQLQGDQDRDPETGQHVPVGTRRLPGNVHFCFPGCEGDSLLFGLDMAGIESSTGSACTAGVSRPSHVVSATGADEQMARSTQRFSLGYTTTEADIQAVLSVLPGVYASAQRAGMAGQDSHIVTANSHRG
ncbi:MULTISPECIES: cysteine desulfurase family protein [Auritidibacter]|uniref:cysteine desulfurase family protein n=1 Tax=Auritidibacter TaxID=1160973 RepID=UPI000D7269F7|nr:MULTISPECIES: cysteine desulfurase family protein [Auritidibacter]PXA80826.1 cysteine desulfurase NifS [Auritidibacter sp. NML120779]AXR73161.1 cysteine desulfurase [Auritidibacter sp. NML130574]NIH71613.1 cysteine desulfurase [Auritidibacter ignavus]PXA81916.1 cysteine desulfurase NifS [Auritidibacter sp. NML120636]RMX24237.1 cysteine desulfurase [Auritidibacter ignavus]